MENTVKIVAIKLAKVLLPAMLGAMGTALAVAYPVGYQALCSGGV